VKGCTGAIHHPIAHTLGELPFLFIDCCAGLIPEAADHWHSKKMWVSLSSFRMECNVRPANEFEKVISFIEELKQRFVFAEMSQYPHFKLRVVRRYKDCAWLGNKTVPNVDGHNTVRSWTRFEFF